MFIPLATDIPEEPKTAVDTTMPTAPIFATPAAPIPTGLSTFFLSFSFSHIFLNLHYEFIPSFCASLMLYFMLLSRSDSC